MQAFSSENEGQWSRVLAPAASALEKDLALAALLEQHLEGAPQSTAAAAAAPEQVGRPPPACFPWPKR